MPKAEFQITVKLKDENSCKGCPCHFYHVGWNTKTHRCGRGFDWPKQIKDGRPLNSAAAPQPIRPESCKANDATILKIGRELQDIIEEHACVDEQGRSVIKESNFEILQANLRGYIGSVIARSVS